MVSLIKTQLKLDDDRYLILVGDGFEEGGRYVQLVVSFSESIGWSYENWERIYDRLIEQWHRRFGAEKNGDEVDSKDYVEGFTPVGTYLDKARELVFWQVHARLENAGDPKADSFAMSDVFVVWFSKTLQNWKALVSTTIPDNMYYEVTYDGNKKQAYMDSYQKINNVTIPLGA